MSTHTREHMRAHKSVLDQQRGLVRAMRACERATCERVCARASMRVHARPGPAFFFRPGPAFFFRVQDQLFVIARPTVERDIAATSVSALPVRLRRLAIAM